MTTGSRFGRTGWLAAVITLAIAAWFGNHSFQLQQQLHQDQSQIAQLSAQAAHTQAVIGVLTSPDAEQLTLTENRQAGQPNGRVVYLEKQGSLIFLASHLHPITADKTYELWLFPADGKTPTAVGLFRPDAKGSASVVLPDLPPGRSAKSFKVTIEDAQGATTPTLPIVLAS